MKFYTLIIAIVASFLLLGWYNRTWGQVEESLKLYVDKLENIGSVLDRDTLIRRAAIFPNEAGLRIYSKEMDKFRSARFMKYLKHILSIAPNNEESFEVWVAIDQWKDRKKCSYAKWEMEDKVIEITEDILGMSILVQFQIPEVKTKVKTNTENADQIRDIILRKLASFLSQELLRSIRHSGSEDFACMQLREGIFWCGFKIKGLAEWEQLEAYFDENNTILLYIKRFIHLMPSENIFNVIDKKSTK